MEIKLNKELINYLNSNGISVTSYSILLSLYNKVDIFDFYNELCYPTIQFLILLGLIVEEFGETEEYIKLTEKGEKLVENGIELTKD